MGRTVSLIGLVVLSACALGRGAVLSEREMAGLWQEPRDLEKRDLFYGPGGAALAPDPSGTFTILEVDDNGFSPGYEVRDSQGRIWNVKLGPEAQPEVVVSRLVWAVGYHQPEVYFVPRWTSVEKGRKATQAASRFRLKSEAMEDIGDWAWGANPFVGTRTLEGLFVLMVMVNNWDLKPSQNAIYRVSAQGDDPRNLYAIKDLGASLGKTSWIVPGSRNDVDGFEKEGFIKRIQGNRVTFYYQGSWLDPHLAAGVAPGDVRWMSNLLARLTPKQWTDAFRAGGYTGSEAARFIQKLRDKIAEGQNIG